MRPLERPQVSIAETVSAGRPPKLDFLPLAKLRIDDTYQRTIERKGLATIVRICNEFDWNRFAPLIVARIPGKEELYAIIDGQHRATAALLRGFDLVPCAIVNASALEQPAIFAAVNGNVTPVTIFQLFKAARAAKAGWAGFDKNAMRAVVNRIRKEEKNGPGMLEQADAMTELYLAAYRGAPEDRQEVAEGNHTSPDAEGTQRPPLPRGGASDRVPRAGALVRVRGEAGEDALPPVSPASDPHDLTLPSFLDRRRRGSVEAAE